jgi:hypothetical protein
MNNINKVHVIYKTHLDVGFTDLAKNVVDKYINSFIPKAIALANKVNRTGENKKFIWTVGSWLIDEYLRRADEDNKQKLIDAVNNGSIVWHGLPFTTHSELMDEELFNFGISICKELDKKFSRKTIAAKMTDVPGHTRGIIEPLSRNGIKYLHIGVNDVSHKPNVPDTFIWKDSKGNEIIVDYCQGYGKTTLIPELDEVLVFAHSGDNMGPPSEQDIYKQLEKIQNQFPNAEVKASTLDSYAESLIKIKHTLPVLTDEIGDTWIHGISTDPYKVSCFLELLRVKDKWIRENQLLRGSTAYTEFLRSLLMIPEHTWGLDFKKYLADYKNWRKEDFIKARQNDKLSDSYIPDKYNKFGSFARKEFATQVKHMNWEDRSYSYYESSHDEQREYIKDAIEVLPVHLKNEARNIIQTLKIKPEVKACYKEVLINEEYEINQFKVTVLKDGSVKVRYRNNQNEITLGKISYELFGMTTFEKWKKEYMVNLEQNDSWAMPDFFKLGIEDAGTQQDNMLFSCSTDKAYICENELFIEASFGNFESKNCGAPRKTAVQYIFNENEIDICAYLYDKDASRIPEAIWISHFTDNRMMENIELSKLKEVIDPFEVVECGNRNYHSIKEVHFYNKESEINIIPLDSTLLSIGERRLYNFNQSYANPIGGLHFNAYNNLWGTNFKMWYEEDIISRFKINIK